MQTNRDTGTNPQQEIKQLMIAEWSKRRAVNPAYSLRAFAKRLGLQPSAVSEILNRNRRVTGKMAQKIVRGLCVEPQKASALLQACGEPQRKRTAYRMGTGALSAADDFAQLSLDHFHVVSDWYCIALISLAETEGFRSDPPWMARRLGITETQARTALERLLRLGILEKDDEGVVRPTGVSLATPSDIADASIRRSHFENLDLARQSLESDPVSERDFSIMTVAGDPDLLPEAKQRIKAFRRELAAFLESGRKREVMRLSIQMFGLSKVKMAKGE